MQKKPFHWYMTVVFVSLLFVALVSISSQAERDSQSPAPAKVSVAPSPSSLPHQTSLVHHMIQEPAHTSLSTSSLLQTLSQAGTSQRAAVAEIAFSRATMHSSLDLLPTSSTDSFVQINATVQSWTGGGTVAATPVNTTSERSLLQSLAPSSEDFAGRNEMLASELVG